MTEQWLRIDNLPFSLGSARRLAQHAWEHFKEDRCFEEAASLGYTSLLALVPLLAVVFVIVSAFPVFDTWSDRLEELLLNNMMPAAGEQVGEGLRNFIGSVDSLTLPGTVGLILTALLLMFRIEVAFNRIWRVERARSLTGRVVIYWAVLTLAPLLIGAAVALGAQGVFGKLGLSEINSPVLLRLGTLLATGGVFALMFLLVPHRRVRFRDALVGAALSAVLFDLAKIGFVAYISNANYAVIYGALATVPIFLFWLYLVWVVILLGASLAASLTTFRDEASKADEWPAGLDFQLAFRLVGHLWQAQRQGEGLETEQLIAAEPLAGERRIQGILARLEAGSVLHADEEERWILTRDLSDLTLGDLYQAGLYHLPLELQDLPCKDSWDRAFAGSMQSCRQHGLEGLEQSLRTLYLQANDEARPGAQAAA